MKKRKLLALILAAALLLSCCACGRSDRDHTENDQPQSGTEQSGQTAAQPADPAAGEKENEPAEPAEPEPPARPTTTTFDYPVEVVTDDYLILVNKTHPLGKDYWPEDLVTVSRCVEGVGNADTHKLRKVAAEALERMLADALDQGIDLRMRTGFRSYAYQADLFASYVKRNGEEKANTFSARAGQSEHQTGLCCDLGGKSEGYALSYDFGKTAEGKWVYEHAHEYGFFIRYTDGKTVDGVRMPGEITGYVYEPWHIRYVGEEVAAIVHEEGICYEEYLNILD